MSDQTPVLEASKRERLGSRYAQRVRAAGQLPGIIYGHNIEPVAIAFDEKTALKYIMKGEKVFQIALDSAEPETVLLKELQFGYLGNNIIHADFARVDLSERVTTRVHVNLIGDAKGLKKADTVLMRPVTEIELDVQVSNIVDHIDVDITDLDHGEALHASDVKLPVSTMKLLSDPDTILAHITDADKQEVEEEAATADGAVAPEVLTERKPEEEGE